MKIIFILFQKKQFFFYTFIFSFVYINRGEVFYKKLAAPQHCFARLIAGGGFFMRDFAPQTPFWEISLIFIPA